MAQSTLKSPRTRYWRNQKTARANQVTARRALERDLTATRSCKLLPTRQRMVAKTYWTEPHPWAKA